MVDLDPPRRYVFEWWYRGGMPPGQPRSSRVEISLSAHPGGTRVDVVERATDVADVAATAIDLDATAGTGVHAASATPIMAVMQS